MLPCDRVGHHTRFVLPPWPRLLTVAGSCRNSSRRHAVGRWWPCWRGLEPWPSVVWGGCGEGRRAAGWDCRWPQLGLVLVPAEGTRRAAASVRAARAPCLGDRAGGGRHSRAGERPQQLEHLGAWCQWGGEWVWGARVTYTWWRGRERRFSRRS